MKMILYLIMTILLLCTVSAQEVFSDTVMGADSCRVDTTQKSILLSGMTILVFLAFIALLFIPLPPFSLFVFSLVYFAYAGHTYDCFRLSAVISVIMAIILIFKGGFDIQ